MASTVPSLNGEVALWICLLAASLSQHFYWTTTTASLLATRAYYVCVISGSDLLASSNSASKSSENQVLSTRNTTWRSVLKWMVFILLLMWCLCLSPLQIWIYTPMDAWTPYVKNRPFESKRVLHDAGPDAVVDIIAIHGLGSDPDSAWTYRGDGSNIAWLRDLLPSVSEYRNTRIAMVNHQTQWDSRDSGMSFEEHAEAILDYVDELRRDCQERPIIFIAHSFGGLLLKRALLVAKQRSNEIVRMTSGVMFLGVPHGGTNFAFTASLISCTAHWRGSSTMLLEYMSKRNPAAARLESEFYDTYVKYRPDNAPIQPYICNFVEKQSESAGKLDLGRMVDSKSGAPHYVNKEYLNCDHRGLNKFRSLDDPNFERFLERFSIAWEYAINIKITEKKIETPRPQKSRELWSIPRRKPLTKKDHDIDFVLPFEVPLQRNGRFTGRQEVLDQINAKLREGTAIPSTVVVSLIGPGGIGKTQVAVEYAYQYSWLYKSVFWIDATTYQSACASFLEAAKRIQHRLEENVADLVDLKSSYRRFDMQEVLDEKLEISPLSADCSKVTKVVKKWLSDDDNKDWLLVFDNLDDIESFDIKFFYPSKPWGTILITSRRSETATFGSAIRVEQMDESEGLSLLKRSAGLQETMNEEEKRAAISLLDELGYLPLAVEQAAAYISVQRQRFALSSSAENSKALVKYLLLFKANKKSLLRHRPPTSSWNYRNDTVFTTWEVSFRAVQAESGKAGDLLQLCGFLNNDNLMELLFLNTRNLVPNDATLQDHIRLYTSYSLLSSKNTVNGISFHPLVHFWIKERLDLTIQSKLSEEVIRIIARTLRHLNQRGDKDEIRWFEWDIVPHLVVAFRHLQEFHTTYSIAERERLLKPWKRERILAQRAVVRIAEGNFFWAWGKVSDVVTYFRSRSFPDIESVLPPWKLTYEVGYLLRRSWTQTQCLSLMQWTFLEACKDLHYKHPIALQIAGDLAQELIALEELDEAYLWYTWLFATRSQVLGPAHHATSGATKGLARIQQKRGKYQEALNMFTSALEARDRSSGPKDRLTQNVLEDIRNLFMQWNDTGKAILWLENLFEAKGKHYWFENTNLIDIVFDIGQHLLNQTRNEEALTFYHLALEMQEGETGCNHRDVDINYNLAMAYYNASRYQAFDTAIRNTQTACNEWVDKAQSEWEQNFEALAGRLWSEAFYNESMHWYQKLQAAQLQRLHLIHPDAQYPEPINTWNNVATKFGGAVKNDRGLANDALNYSIKAFEAANATLGPIHRMTLALIDSIGTVFENCGEHESALWWHELSMSNQENTTSVGSYYWFDAMYSMGWNLMALGRFDEALSWLHHSLEEQHPTEHSFYRREYFACRTLQYMESFEDALQCFLCLLEWHRVADREKIIKNQTIGFVESDSRVHIMYYLHELYLTLNRDALAQKWADCVQIPTIDCYIDDVDSIPNERLCINGTTPYELATKNLQKASKPLGGTSLDE